MVSVIFPAAGQGRRMQAGKNKVLLELAGQPIFLRTLLRFSAVPRVDELIVVTGADEMAYMQQVLERTPGLKPWRIVASGSTPWPTASRRPTRRQISSSCTMRRGRS